MDKADRKKSVAMTLLKSLLVSYIVTGVLLLVLALLLFKMDLDAGKVSIGIIVIYILSSFLGGFVVGKATGNKKYLWGMILGCSYFLILAVISFAVNQTIQSGMGDFITTFIMCVGGGMLGGMLS